MMGSQSHRTLQVIENLERETGIEPATNSLEGCDSTTELLPPRKPSTGGQGRIRTSVDRMGRQIYSLLLLTAQPPVRNCRRNLELAKGFEPPTL